MTRVYVDTSALLPLLDAADDDHEAMKAALEELSGSDIELVTSSYTLVESSALVRSRLGMKAFRALGRAVEALTVVWVDRALHARAWARAEKAGRKGPSLVDCVGFEVMRDLDIEVALAIDGHFSDAGFELLPRDAAG